MRKHMRSFGKVFRPMIDVPESDRPVYRSFEYDTVDGVRVAVSKGEYDDLLGNIRLRRISLTIENKKAVTS